MIVNTLTWANKKELVAMPSIQDSWLPGAGEEWGYGGTLRSNLEVPLAGKGTVNVSDIRGIIRATI